MDSSAPEQRAAQYLLQQLVQEDLLADALDAMQLLSLDDRKVWKPNDSTRLPVAAVQQFLEKTAAPTGLKFEVVALRLRDHLEQVAAFSRSDGGPSPANVRAVQWLISSGRTELFAR